MEPERINWIAFARKMAEAARAKVAENRKQLERIRHQEAKFVLASSKSH
ncbi:MAG TPA: hypothetical protein VHB45_03405 [Alloacidobacterium sp.]|nr:hypothetical protein [Alloacidobacterium sp.]